MVAVSLQNKNKTPITQVNYTEGTTIKHIYKDVWIYYFIALVYYL